MTSKTTFAVRSSTGQVIQATQLGAIEFYVNGEEFKFVVTRAKGQRGATVTHRASGAAVCELPLNPAHATAHDWQVAARAALTSISRRMGEESFCKVLRRAEEA